MFKFVCVYVNAQTRCPELVWNIFGPPIQRIVRLQKHRDFTNESLGYHLLDHMELMPTAYSVDYYVRDYTLLRDIVSARIGEDAAEEFFIDVWLREEGIKVCCILNSTPLMANILIQGDLSGDPGCCVFSRLNPDNTYNNYYKSYGGLQQLFKLHRLSFFRHCRKLNPFRISNIMEDPSQNNIYSKFVRSMRMEKLSIIAFKNVKDKNAPVNCFRRFASDFRNHQDAKISRYAREVEDLFQGHWDKTENRFAIDFPISTAWLFISIGRADMIPELLSFLTRGKVNRIEDLDDRLPEKQMLIEYMQAETSK